MNKARLEAFSDGVFAIVITLLILNIRLPEVDYKNLPDALIKLVPDIIAYVMSFVVIGLYWVGHHISFQNVVKTDGVFLWLNILLLLCVSFIPFPTFLLGHYPMQAIPLVIYGVNLLAANVVAITMTVYLQRHPQLAAGEFSLTHSREHLPIYLTVNGSYLIAISLAFYFPLGSYFIYGLIMAGLIIFYSKRSR